MREIKFRAWFHAEEPRYSKGMQDNPDKMLQVGDDSGTTHPLDCCNYARQGQSVILLQYTGLKDKNGVEAYWDDIADDGINPPFVITEDYHLLARLSEIEFEVIGNIYENPELVG